MEQAREAKLQIHKSNQGEITFLRFVGNIDENFDGAGLAKGLGGQLIVSLAEVRRITSFGIRNWVEFISKAGEACAAVYLVECAPRIVDQLNMVANFAGRGVVVSFYAPFRCDHCGNERLKLIQLDQDGEAIRSMQLEGDACPNDGNQEYLDDDPDSYLSYLATQSEFELDPKVAAFLAGRTQYDVPDGLRKVRIEKKIEDRYTFISVSGDIGDDFPARKIAEGLEGDVVLDLAAVGMITAEGLGKWRAFMAAIAPATERIIVIGLPATWLEQLKRDQDLAEKGQVLSIYLPFACKACAITSQLEIDVAKHFESLRFATPPETSCPDCGKSAVCVGTTEMLNGLTELPQPAKDLRMDKLLEMSRKPTEPAAGPAPTAAPAQVATTVAAPSRGMPALLVIALLGVLGAGVAIYLAVFRGEGGGGGVTFEKRAKLVEASHPKPPKWRDQGFNVQGDQVLVTGSSGFVKDKETGFKQAKSAALDELCQQVAMSIRDPVWVEHVGGQYQQFRTKALGDLEKALMTGDQEMIDRSRTRVYARRARVAKSLLDGAAGMVQPEQSHYYWEKLKRVQEVRYRIWSLFRVRKGEFKRLVQHYAKREEALSASAVPFFPGMAWRYDLHKGSVVVGLKSDSPLRFIGVRPGDVLLSAQDRQVKDGRSFYRVLREEHAELQRQGGTMLLRIQRGDAPVVEHRMRVAKKVATARPKRPWQGRPAGKGTRPGGKKLPPANIWDDNPFE
jgi:eukaryotic-like serine/threonine-protein kinase